MEKEIWIEKIISSANSVARVAPSPALFSKIQLKINSQKVAPKTLWLVAASIALLVLLNITAIKSQNFTTQNSATSYLSETLDQNNQLYQ